MSQCDDDEAMSLSCKIIDSLSGVVGDKITPVLIETIRNVCHSHLREHGVFESPGLDELLENLARRAQPRFSQ